MSSDQEPRWTGAFLASIDHAREALRNLDEAAERLMEAECNANAAGAHAATQDFAVFGKAAKAEAARGAGGDPPRSGAPPARSMTHWFGRPRVGLNQISEDDARPAIPAEDFSQPIGPLAKSIRRPPLSRDCDRDLLGAAGLTGSGGEGAESVTARGQRTVG